ncbi:MAG: hypothetical protein GXP15_06090 [Gammaproteobacteria bacterium]|nr:hypothetical protein [Gammaproteobacteria bacterium]
MNNVFVFVLLIILIGTLGGVAKTYLKQGKRRSEQDEDAAEMQATIERLEERIEVLERIVTEKHIDLRQEIASL